MRLRWLLVRPDAPILILSKNEYAPIMHSAIQNLGRDNIGEEYPETERHRAVTSHFGRQRFKMWWCVGQDVPPELATYMRGDKDDSGTLDGRGAVDEHVYTYKEDVKGIYRERMFRLRV